MIPAIVFNFLSLTLFGVGLYFAYRHAKGEMLAAKNEMHSFVRAAVRRVRKKLKAVEAENEKLRQQFSDLEQFARREKTQSGGKGPNPFVSMEDRYEEHLSKAIRVNGEEVPLG